MVEMATQLCFDCDWNLLQYTHIFYYKHTVYKHNYAEDLIEEQ